MTQHELALPKHQRRVVVDPAQLKGLYRQVFSLDGHRCRNFPCLSLDTHNQNALHPHHIIYQSEGGDDTIANLITLCPLCHQKAHNGTVDPRTQCRISGREFMLHLLDRYIGTSVFRWHNAYAHIKRLVQKRQEGV